MPVSIVAILSVNVPLGSSYTEFLAIAIQKNG